MRRNYRADVSGGNSLLRGHAAAMLSDSFEDEDGALLVNAMLNETELVAFRRISNVVMGKWSVKMESVLSGLAQWPIAPNCTVWFAIKSRMWSYPSYERFLLQHITGDEWLYKYAAVVYCRHHGFHLDLLLMACEELLFAMPQEDRDWEAVAISTGLRSQRNLRQMIERIAADMEPAPEPPEWLHPDTD